MMAFRIAGVAALALLYGCVSEAQITAESIDAGKTHCAREGKQFILKSTEKKPGTFFQSGRIIVTGVCVGPGDPGYVAPSTVDKKPSQR